MASMLSCLASLMKEQVLTMITSASFSSVVISYASLERTPSITSASTRFLGQPRLTMLTFCFTFSLNEPSLVLISEIHKLHLDVQVFSFEELDSILQVVAVFAGHPHLVVLDLGLHLELALLDDGDDLLALFL